MKVQRLTAADAAALRELRLEALQREPAAFGSTTEDERDLPVSSFAARLEAGVTFGLRTGAGLEGLLVYDRHRGGHTRHRAKLYAVYVRHPLRGSGGAGLLLEAAVAQAKSDGVVQIELDVAEVNVRARAFYRARGFEEVGRMPRALHVGGIYLDEILMLRRLDDA